MKHKERRNSSVVKKEVGDETTVTMNASIQEEDCNHKRQL